MVQSANISWGPGLGAVPMLSTTNSLVPQWYRVGSLPTLAVELKYVTDGETEAQG